MRVLIETAVVAEGWTITYTDPQTAAPLTQHRTVTRCAAPNARFPQPPLHDVKDCTPNAHKVCLDASGANALSGFESVNRVDVPHGHVDIFGCYLFQVLIGENWAVLETAARGGNIDVEILIPSSDRELTALPWEMMFLKDVPLGAQLGRKVSIVRTITPEIPVPQPSPVQLPLKVLFIVGRQVDDALRPGAELIGLLRRVRLPLNPAFTTFQTTHMHVRYLAEAAWDEVEQAVSEFHPTVVHIVSHGEVDPEGGGIRLLLTAREVDGVAGSLKTRDPYPCTADRLFDLLSAGGARPLVIVVNACHTADVDGQNAADRAFAARLVERGTPIALGMSGEVADRACQVFTLSFYQALLKGESPPQASAQGRRAALLDFPEDQHAVEWTRPTVFLANGIVPDLKTVPAPIDLSGIAERYRTLKIPDALCDRFECMAHYEDFRKSLPPTPGQMAAVAFVTKDANGGLGKTRLLEEVAARAVFDGYVPVVVRNDRRNPEAPHNVLEIALQISEAVEEARRNFELKASVLTKSREFAYALTGVQPQANNLVTFQIQERNLKKFLQENRNSGPPAELEMNDILPLIRAECLTLLNDLPAGTGPWGVLLMLDDLQRYAGAIERVLPALGEYGFGTPALPLPVVFTCLVVETDKRLEEATLAQQIRMIPLTAFETELEQRLACRQFVLSHFKAYIPTRKDRQKIVERFYNRIQLYTKGRPRQFLDPTVKGVIDGNIDSETLVRTDLEAMLEKWK